MEHKDEFEELVTLHALGTLKGEELREVEEHLRDGCKACRDILEETELVLSLFPYSLADSPLSHYLLDKILKRINSTEMVNVKSYPLSFEEIFDRYANTVYGLALNLLGDESDAEEVVEKVFSGVRRRLRKFEDETKLLEEIYRLTVNAALSKFRRLDKKKKRTDIKDLMPRFRKDGHHDRPVVDWSEQTEKVKLERELSNAINCIPLINRVVLVLSDVGGMSDRNVGDILKLGPKEVRTKLHRARLLLRGNLAISLGYQPV